jgi:DNA sulfur modification protein DndB
MDRATISNRSVKLFTLSSIYFATRQLLRKAARATLTRAEQEFAFQFWSEVAKNMSDWQLAAQRKVTSAELRRTRIHAHGVALQAIAMAGAELIDHDSARWPQRLKALEKIDWSRTNGALWEGRTTIGGRVSKATSSVVLTANVIKEQLGIPLTESQGKLEKIYGDARPRRQRKHSNSSVGRADAQR